MRSHIFVVVVVGLRMKIVGLRDGDFREDLSFYYLYFLLLFFLGFYGNG